MLLAAPGIYVRLVEMRTRGQDDQRGDGYRQEEYEQKDAIQDQAHLPIRWGRRTHISIGAAFITYLRLLDSLN